VSALCCCWQCCWHSDVPHFLHLQRRYKGALHTHTHTLSLSEKHVRVPLADLCTPSFCACRHLAGGHSLPCTEEITHKPWFLTITQLPLLQRDAARISQSFINHTYAFGARTLRWYRLVARHRHPNRDLCATRSSHATSWVSRSCFALFYIWVPSCAYAMNCESDAKLTDWKISLELWGQSSPLCL
jgi:hypothetical protein